MEIYVFALLFVKRAERKTRRQNGSAPRQIKRTRDMMKEKAKREEFSSKGVQQSHGKCKKNKKKNMEGFSNSQWEERHPDQVPTNAREKDIRDTNGTEHDKVFIICITLFCTILNFHI